MQVYKALGLTCASVQPGMRLDDLQQAYSCDVTYVTGQQLCFDWLGDQLATRVTDLVRTSSFLSIRTAISPRQARIAACIQPSCDVCDGAAAVLGMAGRPAGNPRH